MECIILFFRCMQTTRTNECVLFDNESSVILGIETGSRYRYLWYLPTYAKLRRNLVMGEPSLGTRLKKLHREILIIAQGCKVQCGDLNALSEVLQDPYTFCDGQNGNSKLLQASYRFCGDQNAHSESQLAYYRLSGGQNAQFKAHCGDRNSNSAPLLDYYELLRWSKRNLRSSASSLHTLQWSKRALRTSTSFIHVLRWSKRTPTQIAGMLKNPERSGTERNGTGSN